MLIWHPDTCNCIIECDEQWEWVATLQRCMLHRESGPDHLTEVVRHHTTFNDPSRYTSTKGDDERDRPFRGLDEKGDPLYGDTPAEKHRRWLCAQAKAAERQRSGIMEGDGDDK